jgi:hypothetical protein
MGSAGKPVSEAMDLSEPEDGHVSRYKQFQNISDGAAPTPLERTSRKNRARRLGSFVRRVRDEPADAAADQVATMADAREKNDPIIVRDNSEDNSPVASKKSKTGAAEKQPLSSEKRPEKNNQEKERGDADEDDNAKEEEEVDEEEDDGDGDDDDDDDCEPNNIGGSRLIGGGGAAAGGGTSGAAVSQKKKKKKSKHAVNISWLRLWCKEIQPGVFECLMPPVSSSVQGHEAHSTRYMQVSITPLIFIASFT